MNEVRRDWIPSVVFAVACGFTSPVFAADWLPVTAAELQLTSEPKAPGAAATYLYRQVDRDDRTSTEYVYCRLKILREEGRKYADVEISYAKGSESIQSIEARTIRPDGSFVAFDRTVYDKPIVDGRGVRLMAKTFTMPEAGVGSIIEYRYRRVQNFNLVYDSRWIVSQELFTQHAKFSLIPSEYFPLRWTWSRGALDGTASPQKDRAGVVRLDTHDIPAFVAEELMPPANELKFRVDFIYLERDNVEKTPEAYWKRVNRDRFSEIEKFVRSKKAMEHAVATIASSTTISCGSFSNPCARPTKSKWSFRRRSPSRNVNRGLACDSSSAGAVVSRCASAA
jgi:hypothetical protein